MTTVHASRLRSPAPWADVVPGVGPVTVDILLTIPDHRYVYEVVEGVLVRVAGSGKSASAIALALGAEVRGSTCAGAHVLCG